MYVLLTFSDGGAAAARRRAVPAASGGKTPLAGGVFPPSRLSAPARRARRRHPPRNANSTCQVLQEGPSDLLLWVSGAKGRARVQAALDWDKEGRTAATLGGSTVGKEQLARAERLAAQFKEVGVPWLLVRSRWPTR